MRHRFLFLLLLPLSAHPLRAQPGCTDPQATNYDPAAASNDGSCVYPATAYAPVAITPLATALGESSGLVVANGAVWTHNDSGGAPEIYQIDTLSGAVLKTVTIGGAANVDWEDMAFDGTHFYVGDFGNNANGNRTDLNIYKFPLAAIPPGDAVLVPETAVETIAFVYEDQADFTPQGANNTRFDCEAMCYRDGQLHLFTKDWIDQNSAHYTLPAVAGAHTALRDAAFFAGGLITGADITAKGVIVLLGYRLGAGQAFMWLLYDYPDSHFFSGNKREIALGSVLAVGQVEGICFRDTGYGYISNEKVLSLIPARLYGFDISAWLPAAFLPAKAPVKKNDGPCDRLPNPVGAAQLPEGLNGLPADARAELWDSAGRQVWQSGTPVRMPASVSPGVYTLRLLETRSPGQGCYRLLFIK